MKALMKDFSSFDMVDIPEPVCGPEQVKIKVQYAGICASDLHILKNDIALKLRLPVVLGHEFTGIVAEVGSKVLDFKFGDHVSSETTFVSCKHCEFCLTGQYNLCKDKELIGYVHNGAFAEYIVVPARFVKKLDGIDLLSGVMLEPLACCTHALREVASIAKHKSVLIAGPGAIGLLCLQMLKGQDVMIYGPESARSRLQVADAIKKDGAILEKYVEDMVAMRTKGRGIDVFIECSGSRRAIQTGLNLLARDGLFIQLGIASKDDDYPLDTTPVVYKELTMVGSLGSNETSWEKAMQLVRSGFVKTRPLVTVYPFDQWSEAFVSAINGVTSIKSVLDLS